jgi:two-component system NtrC family response regulator
MFKINRQLNVSLFIPHDFYFLLLLKIKHLNTILIIDDEDKIRSLLARILKDEGYAVQEAGDGKSGLQKLAKSETDIVLCDVKLPDCTGLDLVERIKATSPASEVILLTAYGTIKDSVLAIKNGAYNYLVKGDDNDRIIPVVHNALEKVKLQKRILALEKSLGQKYSFDSIIGHSRQLKEVVELARKVAPLDATVLLTGETGTGKEIFAQSIHQASKRRGKSFVALNCSAFSKDILESELFGYKQGAFTGALKDKKGLIEEANGGTLFLDEIGEMPLELQAKLLRVLESNEFIRLGDTKVARSDFRLIAATNKDLKAESEEQRFRSDLYFRLNIFQIPLPSLKERIKDIEPLTRHYAAQSALKTNRAIVTINDDFIEALKAYHWPGNIRELKNVIERAVILCGENGILDSTLLPYEMQHAHPVQHHHQLSAFSIASVEKLHILKVLNHTKGNKAEAARLLEIGPATLYRKMEEYGIK